MNDDEQPSRLFAKWISMGDIIVLAASLGSIAISYGDLRRQVDELSDDIGRMQSIQVGPTPEAARAIAAINVKDEAQDEIIADIRAELRSQRQEILTAVNALGQKLDQHMGR